ncbi:uncharacterized protein [Panulirus ornatus]|uniref:uncharacterized protein n=1 Tax=Panulirus ornatus TaxID=150431 RepID=UPI003A8C103C
MLRVLLFVTVIVVAMAATPRPPCPRPKEDISCTNWCDIQDSFGHYFCCDKKGNHPGLCPSYPLKSDELAVLCDVHQPGYPFHLDCRRDDDCPQFQKCCSLPDNNQYICRNSVFS